MEDEEKVDPAPRINIKNRKTGEFMKDKLIRTVINILLVTMLTLPLCSMAQEAEEKGATLVDPA